MTKQSAARSSVLSGLASASVTEVLTRLIQLATVSVAARLLGGAGLGVIGIAWALYGIAQTFAHAAPEVIGVREVALAGPQAGEMWRAALPIVFARVIFSVVACIIIIAIAKIIDTPENNAFVQTIAQSSVLLAGSINLSWIFRGLGELTRYGVLRAIQAIATIVLATILLLWFRNPVSLPIGESIGTIITALFAWQQIRKDKPPLILSEILGQSLLPTLRESFTFGLATVCNAITWTSMIPIAGLYVTPQEIGQLTGALRLVIALNISVQPLIYVFHQILSRRYAEDGGSGAELAGILLLYTAIGAIVTVLGLGILAKPVMWILLGPNEVAAAPIFQMLLPSLIPAATGSVLSYALLAAGYIKAYSIVSVITSIVSVSSLAFGYQLFGIQAAAMITILVAGQTACLAALAFRYALVTRSTLSFKYLTLSRLRHFLSQR